MDFDLYRWLVCKMMGQEIAYVQHFILCCTVIRKGHILQDNIGMIDWNKFPGIRQIWKIQKDVYKRQVPEL